MEQNNEKTDRCQWSNKCEAQVEIVYLGCGLCDKHWQKIADMTMEEAHKKLGIKDKIAPE